MATPRLSHSAELYDDHAERLQPLMAFFSERGGALADDELINLAEQD